MSHFKIRLVGKPRDAAYLTPGKIYDAVRLGRNYSALVVDDEGDKIQIDLLSCPHARPAKWEEVSDDQ